MVEKQLLDLKDVISKLEFYQSIIVDRLHYGSNIDINPRCSLDRIFADLDNKMENIIANQASKEIEIE